MISKLQSFKLEYLWFQTNEAHKELLESLQARLDQSNNQLATTEQQLIQVEQENNMLKNEKYKVTGWCYFAF